MGVVLDLGTLTVVMAVVSLCVLVLFYFDAYRANPTGSARWWCLALALLCLAGILNTGGVELVSLIGQGLMVMGIAAMWAGVRRLRDPDAPAVYLALVVLGTGLAAFAARFADPYEWGVVVLLVLSGGFCAAIFVELRRQHTVPWRTARSFAMIAAITGVYDLVRALAVMAQGGTSPAFKAVFGQGFSLLAAIVLIVAAGGSLAALNNATRTAHFQQLATKDSLTGLLNRVEFMRRAAELLRRAQEQGAVVTVIMADLDKFKSINDDFGHLVGDEVIRAFGVACRQSVRSGDLVGRFGGEEFIMALADSTAADGVAVAERIQFVLAAQRILLDGHTVPTASFGVADSALLGTSLDALIASADEALYAAKSAGRNCVMVSGAAPIE